MKKTYARPIILGFFSLYFVCMLLLTYFVQDYFSKGLGKQALFAALDYLKFVYLFGLLLLVVCVVKATQVTKKVYEKQETIEKRKTRMIKAMASNFNQPLEEIHHHIDVLKRDDVVDSDFAIDQIIAKTEEMDKIIQKLIALAKT